MKRALCKTLFLLLLCFTNIFAADDLLVKSPDGKIIFRIGNKDEKLVYQVSFNNSPVILNSPLVLTLDGKQITSNVKIKDSKKYAINETYPWLGVHGRAVNHCNGLKINMEQGNLRFTVDIRAFNDGAAFQIIIPGRDNDKRIPDERSEERRVGKECRSRWSTYR